MQSAIRFIQLLGNHNLQNSASFTYKKNKWVLFHALTSAIQRKDAGAANTIFEILKSNNVYVKFSFNDFLAINRIYLIHICLV